MPRALIRGLGMLAMATSLVSKQRRLPVSQRRRDPVVCSPRMVISPEAMVSLQKMTNRKSFEETVSAYAKQKRLSTREAELE